MGRPCIRLVIASVFFLVSLLVPIVASAQPDKGPLAEYVAKVDNSYGWKVRREGKIDRTDYVELILTSQTWRGMKWQHQLFILNPPTATKENKQALLLIAGSSWNDKFLGAPQVNEKLPGEARLLAAAAFQMKTPVAILLQVPKQPMFDGLHEDEIISHTFQKYLETGDPSWPLLLPMVKSAVKGMDAIQEYSAEKWSYDIQNFTVTGASKRGWTTWLAGAIDPRVNAIAPMVIDVLNMKEHLEHQIEVWGKYSDEIQDYTEKGIQNHLATDEGDSLRQVVDPYHYLNNLTQPKLLMIGTNDEYWPIDSLSLYWNDLQGENHILYVPNEGHGLGDFQRVIGSLNAIHQQAAGRTRLPKLKWKFSNGGNKVRLSIDSDQAPSKVQVWIAESPKQDFRHAVWQSFATQKEGDSHVYEMENPTAGFAAILGEAVFDLEETLPYFLSTNVQVLESK